MRNLTNTLLFLAAFCGLAAFAHGEDRWETLRAINWVENPTNHARFGSKGELGPYQFRSQTWKMHTKRPFSHATDRAAADEVAVKHYEWIKKGLVKAGINPTPYRIAMAWNCGLDAVISGRVPRVTYNYAERVRNLVESLKAQQQVASAPTVSEVTEVARVVRFNIDAPATVPVFVIPDLDRPLYEPVVVTEKAAPSSTAVAAVPAQPTNVDRPMFTVATVSAPRFALLH